MTWHRLPRSYPVVLAATVAIGCAFGWLGASGTFAAANFTEYPLAHGQGPSAITAGPDGNVWFSVGGGHGSIGRIDSSGQVTLFSSGLTSTPTSSAGTITAGPDGNVWFTEHPSGGDDNGAIGWISPSGTISETTAGLGAGLAPTGITAGGEGNLWITDSGGTGTTIVRLTPAGAATDFAPAALLSAQASDPVAGPDGNVWFLLSGGPYGPTGAIGRITPAGSVTVFTTGLTPGGQPSGLVRGPDGNLWFTQSSASAGGVGFITPSGAVTELPHSSFGPAQPGQIAAGSDGNLYVAENAGPGAIVEVTTSGTVTQVVSATSGPPVAITGQPGGDVWVAETGKNYIGRLALVPLPSPSGATGVTAGATGSAGSVPDSQGGFSPPTKPVFGVRAGAQPHGVILVRTTPGGPLVKLSAAADIPIGSLVVARSGTVRLVLAMPAGTTQAVSVGRGRFILEQPKKLHGMTALVLAGGNFAACPGGATAASVKHHATAKRKHVVRQLWAKDHDGRFRTFGNNSVATVRGTEWLTQDRCDGTLTKVLRGVVRVRDRRSGRTVTLTAGHSYLAKRGL